MVGINTITFVMHAEAYQEASDGSTLLTLLFDPRSLLLFCSKIGAMFLQSQRVMSLTPPTSDDWNFVKLFSCSCRHGDGGQSTKKTKQFVNSY